RRPPRPVRRAGARLHRPPHLRGADMTMRLITGNVHDPHGLLGLHEGKVRILRRGASDVVIVADGVRYPATRIQSEGVFEASVPPSVTTYRIEVDGAVLDDPYRHLPSLGDFDLQLIREGRHERLWTVLGAQVRDDGVSFAVWAPNAEGVRV